MVENCLILLTNYYPYYKGEEYIETEIEYLSKEFSKIYIISTMVDKSMKKTRNTPENVIIIPSGVKHSIFGKINMFLSKYKQISQDNKKKNMIKEDSQGSIIKKAYTYYFEARALSIYDEVEQLLQSYDFEKFNKVTIYSYWLYITARVGIELKNDFFKDKETYIISRAHGYDVNTKASLLNFLPQRDFLLKELDYTYPCSQSSVDYLQTTYPQNKEKVAVRRLGTRLISDSNIGQQKPFHIVTCSTVRKLKRLDLLIEALSIIEEKDIDYKWTHLGDGPEFNNIKKLADKKLKKGHVDLLGSMSNDKVLSWYKDNHASVFINVSSSEGVPVSIMEALSVGLPIIATDAGGTKEIVDDNMNGFLLDIDISEKELACIIEKMIDLDQETYRKFSINSKEIWKERSNAEELYSKFAREIK